MEELLSNFSDIGNQILQNKIKRKYGLKFPKTVKKIETSNKKEEIKGIDRSDLMQIRGLLKSYPLKISFIGNTFNPITMAQDIVSIYDLLDHCRTKSKKSEVVQSIEEEMKIIKRLPIEEFRKNLFKLSEDIEFGKTKIKGRISKKVEPDASFISNIILKFILVMPKENQKTMHVRSLHGFPGADALEYESSEIKEGKKITEGDKFKMGEEGELIPLENE